eukprot:scaffold6068_cov112-Skeletonema_menzelii.AAC.1
MGKDTKCKTHNCELEHVPCNAKITITESPKSECVMIRTDGNHCREQISREEWHTVKQTSGQREQWKNIAHYHFNCYNFLNKVERQQLLTLIEHGDYMDHDSLQNLKESMNEDN